MITDMKLLVDSHHGIYCGQVFAASFPLTEWGMSAEDAAILKEGPENEEYTFVFDDLCDLDAVRFDDKEWCVEWREGDIWAVCYDIPEGWVEMDLPEWTICALVNDDWSGLDDDEEKELREWLEREPLRDVCPMTEWNECGFMRDHDGPGLAANCIPCLVSYRESEEGCAT